MKGKEKTLKGVKKVVDYNLVQKDLNHQYSQKGITLVALVVTIIVLLILAGITIMTLFGDNGLITMAQKAKSETENSQANDIAGVGGLENQMNDVLNGSGGSTGGSGSDSDGSGETSPDPTTPSKPVTTKDLKLGLNAQIKKTALTEENYSNRYVSNVVDRATASSSGSSMDVDFKLCAYLENLRKSFEEIRSAVRLDVENQEKIKDAVVEGTLQFSITYDNRITFSEEEKNKQLSVGNMYGFNDACRSIFKDIDRKILEGKVVQQDGSIVDMPGYNTLVITLKPCRTEGYEELYASAITDDDRIRFEDLDKSYQTMFADIDYYINGLNIFEASFDSAKYYTISSTLLGNLIFKFPEMSVSDYSLNINYEQVLDQGNNYSGVEAWQDVSATAGLLIKTTSTGGRRFKLTLKLVRQIQNGK